MTAAAVATGIFCLEKSGFALTPAQQVSVGDTEGRHRHRLRCAQCGHSITEAEQRIVVDGAHAHRHRNPAGQVFEIGCFRVAPGCSHSGEATAEFTWFAGYRWDIAWCEQCGTHVGWRYSSVQLDGFHGLILDRLTGEQ